MKKIIILSVLISALFSCRNQEQSGKKITNGKSETGNNVPELQKKMTIRDISVTPANSFSDLFMDSLSMEKYIADSKLNDTLTRRIRSFYNARNYEYAWFTSAGLTEHTRGFWNLQSYYATINKEADADHKIHSGMMERLTSAENLSVSPNDKNILQAELMLTEHLISYVLNNYEDGIVKRKELERFIPIKKRDPLEYADSLLNKKHKNGKYYEDDNTAYKGLKEQLQKYYAIAAKGGWPVITGKQFKIGSSSPEVLKIKIRLQGIGEMPADSTPIFNAQLENAVKTFQTSLGLTPTGTVNESLIKDMNVPAVKRVEQILINMDRMRWMPEAEGNLILVNIPEFVLHVFEGKKKAFDMNVVVGKEGHNTMMFKGDLSQIVFSPYWNITPDIVKEEIMPAIAKNPNYLASHNMEMTPGGGVRQLPGEKNSLGKVKFLFPNSFNIYFHDTPAKSLFSKDKRAYSHGCIRLSDPVKMAQYLLRNQPEWTAEKIDAAMNSGNETFVKINKSVPVIITYYTAWVDENGLMNFRDDIYNQDGQLAKKMFTGSL